MTAPTPDTTFSLAAPRSLRLLADGRLVATLADGAEHVVTVRPCFPWTDPARHFSLRGADDAEVAFVREAGELDPASRGALTRALAASNFLFEITGIDAIDEEIEINRWRVRTRQGDRVFEVARDEFPREVPGGGLLIRDVAGDLYYVADADALDEASQARLLVYVD